MSSNSQGWITCITWIAAAALLMSGCAASREMGQAAWLKLPSPKATLRASDHRPQQVPAPLKSNATTTQPMAQKGGQKAAAGDKEPVTLAILRGRNLERSGDFEKARELYEELNHKHPGNPQIAHRLGVVADAQRRHAEAEAYFQVALTHDPLNPEVLGDLGYCYFLQGQLSKAESALTKSTLRDPSNKRNRNNLGLVLGHLGRHEEALAHFRLANPEADACYNLAFIYAAQERVADAKVCFQMALNADPTHHAARQALASFEEYEERPEHMRDLDTLADDNVRWVPYVEGGNADAEVAPAVATTYGSRDASRVTRALHEESRGMLNRNMQSQRNDEPAFDAKP